MVEPTTNRDLRELTFEFEQLMYREAQLLDSGHFVEWLKLLDDELEYWAPARPFVAEPPSPSVPISDRSPHYWETKQDLRTRIRRAGDPSAWAFHPPSRVRRIIGNVRILEVADPIVRLESNFSVFCSRADATDRTYVGRREDRWRRLGPGSARLVERRIELDHNLLDNILTFF